METTSEFVGSPLGAPAPTEVGMLRADVVQEILARLARGEGVKRIARELVVDRKTVKAWRRRGAWRARLAGTRRRELDGFATFLEQRAPEVGWNGAVLHRELRALGFTGGYLQVQRYLQPQRAARQWAAVATTRFETEPGEHAQVDFGQLRLWIADVLAVAHLFVFTLGYSRRQWARAYPHERLDVVLDGHERAFHHFGGVPLSCLYDNPRTQVLGRRAGQVLWHPVFEDFARTYGFTPRACQPYRPQTKGKVESGVSMRPQPRRRRRGRRAGREEEPRTPWMRAGHPMMGVTPIMEFAAQHYGRQYAPNTRETVRRQTIHQFMDAGLIVANPDSPSRPVNSPKAVYQIEAGALELLRTFGSAEWDKRLRTYLTSVETLAKRYAREREMARIPLTIAPGKDITLSGGGQNVLVKEIVEQFCPRFTPGAIPVYVGDADEKWAYFDKDLLRSLGVEVDSHGKMPDVVVYHKQKGWLVLIEAVTSHGPVDAKRRGELEALFKGCKAGLVYVTVFLNRRAMVKYLDDISWETEVWVAESPSHLIHFNGERFLGPHGA